MYQTTVERPAEFGEAQRGHLFQTKNTRIGASADGFQEGSWEYERSKEKAQSQLAHGEEGSKVDVPQQVKMESSSSKRMDQPR